MDLGGAEGREAVHECDTDLDFGSLAVGVSDGDALSEGFQAAHFCIDPTSGVIARPPLPEGPAVVSGGAQGFIADACRRTVFLPQSTILADRNDRDRVAREDRAVAPARVIGTIGGHGADFSVFGDLVQQIWQDGAVTVSANRMDSQSESSGVRDMQQRRWSRRVNLSFFESRSLEASW